MQIYHVETQEDYDALMFELEGKGVRWVDGTFPTDENCFELREDKTAILLNDNNEISHGSLHATKRENETAPIQKYKAKQNTGNTTREITKDLNEALINLSKPLRPTDKQNDVVNSPNHYTQGELEVIDILQDKLTPQEFEGFLKGNILKYTFREGIKNGTEDMKKAAWYTTRLIKFRGDNNDN